MATQMDRNEVFEQTRLIMARTFGIPAESIGEHTRADDVRGWDSLTHLVVLTGIEKVFDITLPTADAYGAQNAGALVDLVWTIVSHSGGHG